jgi:hypothetical protein
VEIAHICTRVAISFERKCGIDYEKCGKNVAKLAKNVAKNVAFFKTIKIQIKIFLNMAAQRKILLKNGRKAKK